MADVQGVRVLSFDRARDAAAALSADRDARVIGGGTLLMRAVNEGQSPAATLVRVRDPELRRLRTASTRFELGASVTMADLLAEPALACLHAPARSVGGPAVRQMATIGGNLLAPAPYGDLAVALLALDARVLVQAGYSARELPLAEFLRDRSHDTGQGAPRLVTGVTCSAPRELRYSKLARVHPKGVAVVSVAVHLDNRGGRASQVRIAAGAVAATPVRLTRLERALEGQRLDLAHVNAAIEASLADLDPPTDAIASGRYRRAVLPVQLRRLLLGEAA